MSTIIDNETTIETHRDLTRKITELKSQRAKAGRELRSTGIVADEQILADLSDTARKAQQALSDLDRQITEAESRKSALDAAADRGEGSVEDDMELFSAGTAVRRLRGKRTSVEAEARRAQRALGPFLADEHLALLAADTLEDLVDIPVLVRKRASDVQGFTDAIVLSQVEPIENYGTAHPSGRVRFSEIGTTGLDLEALEAALRATGSEVQVHPGLIDFEVALWPTPHLTAPTAAAVGHFADILARTFQAHVEGPTANRGYSKYATLWETTEASLEITEPGKAKGRVVASFGVERERPPLEQMRHFIIDTLSHFQPGVHTAAGLLESLTVVEVLDAGPWLLADEPYIHERMYPQRFIVTIELDYSYEPVKEVS